MSLLPIAVSVKSIILTGTAAIVVFKEYPKTQYLAQYSYPGYSSIYAMLMGAAAKQLPLNDVEVSDDGTNSIQMISLNF